MIKIEFPADRPDIAEAMSKALAAIAKGDTASALEEPLEAPKQPASTAGASTQSLPEETETEHTGTALTAEPDSGAPSETDAPAGEWAETRFDLKNVSFNPAFCGQAAEPFYATGKMRGQWKKKKGVDQSEYDNWYDGQLASRGLDVPERPVDASSAFATRPPEHESPDAPSDPGALMVWVSEKQSEHLLTQEDVNQAWSSAGVSSPADLFGDNAGDAVARVFNFLNAKVQ